MTVVLFGLLPALRASRPDLQFALRSTRAGSGRRAVHLRRLLVGGQVAVAAVLLVGAGLFARSLVKLTSIELGFDPTRVLTMRLNLPEARYATTEAWIGFPSHAARSTDRSSGRGDDRYQQRGAARRRRLGIGCHERRRSATVTGSADDAEPVSGNGR